MKRLIPLLLILVLLAGCDKPAKEYDFSEEYGFSIRVSGWMTEIERKETKFSFQCGLGLLEFRRFTDSEKPVNQEGVELFVENNINDENVEIKELENGAFLVTLPPYGGNEADERYQIVEIYYFIQSGRNTWRIHYVSDLFRYNEEALLTMLQSIRFVEE